MNQGKIILASRSPRRSQLLQWAEVNFEVAVADTEESFPAGLTPEQIAIHIAEEKARVVWEKYKFLTDAEKARPVLAADTIVVLHDQVIGKPSSREDAVQTLSLLSGNTHQVITGVCILTHGEKIVFAEKTNVTFFDLSREQIAHYVDNYKPYDKAGAYAIQEWIGVVGIKSIEGDFYNVMGLPVSAVIRELEKLE